MPDINNLIKELDSLIVSITSDHASIKAIDNKRIGIIGLDISINVSPLNLLENIQHDEVPQYRSEHIEPLIDVIEDKNTIRVIAVLPGIRKEDVHYWIKENFLEIEIFSEHIYRKKIPCDIKPEQVSVKSTTVTNSVLQIVFTKNAKPQDKIGI